MPLVTPVAFRISEARSSDYDYVLAFYNERCRSVLPGGPLPRHADGSAEKSALFDPSRVRWFLARSMPDEEIIGAAQLSTYMTARGRKGRVEYVGRDERPEYDRQGIGKRLMWQLMDTAHHLGLIELNLRCEVHRTHARMLYAKFGFLLVDDSQVDFVWRPQR